MSLSHPPEISSPALVRDTSVLADGQLSPTPSSTSPTFPDHSVIEQGFHGALDQRDDAVSTKADSATSSRLKKKFNELDIRGAMADLDLRKGGKRTGIEDFYIQLDEPHRMYWCPGEVVRGQVHLSLDRPVKTQFVILKLTGLLSVSMVRDKVEYVIFEEEFLLWGTKIHATSYDRTYSREDTAMEYDTPKKQKEEWETGVMDEGEHPFPFEFDLPAKSMPSSIDFGKGSITYTIHCIHQRPPTLLGALKNRTVRAKDVPILDVIDVAVVRTPKPICTRQPDHSRKGKASGDIKTEIELHKAGYLKGEQIRLNIKIRHTKPIKIITGAIVTLYRMSRFDSPRGEPSTFRKDLAQTISPIICDPRTLECSVSPRIRIPPDTFPTIYNVKYISFRYYLEVLLDLNPKTSVFQSSTPQDYGPEEIKAGPSNFIDTVSLMKKNKPFVQCHQFEIVVGTIDSAAKDLEVQLQRQEQLLHHYPPSQIRGRLPMGTFPSAPDLTRRRDSATSTASSTASYARHPPPPPPFTRGVSSPAGITLAGGPPHSRSHSASSRASISKSALAQREQALLPSAPSETIDADDEDASAPPIILEPEDPTETRSRSEPPRIHILHSHESLSGLRIEIPPNEQNTNLGSAADDEAYLASLQSRVSAPCWVPELPPHQYQYEFVGVLFRENWMLKKLLLRLWMIARRETTRVYLIELVLRVHYHYIPSRARVSDHVGCILDEFLDVLDGRSALQKAFSA